MTKRVVLTPDESPFGLGLRVSVEHGVDASVFLRSYDEVNTTRDVMSLTAPEARHLARWLRDEGFLDEPCPRCEAYKQQIADYLALPDTDEIPKHPGPDCHCAECLGWGREPGGREG